MQIAVVRIAQRLGLREQLHCPGSRLRPMAQFSDESAALLRGQFAIDMSMQHDVRRMKQNVRSHI